MAWQYSATPSNQAPAPDPENEEIAVSVSSALNYDRHDFDTPSRADRASVTQVLSPSHSMLQLLDATMPLDATEGFTQASPTLSFQGIRNLVYGQHMLAQQNTTQWNSLSNLPVQPQPPHRHHIALEGHATAWTGTNHSQPVSFSRTRLPTTSSSHARTVNTENTEETRGSWTGEDAPGSEETQPPPTNLGQVVVQTAHRGPRLRVMAIQSVSIAAFVETWLCTTYLTNSSKETFISRAYAESCDFVIRPIPGPIQHNRLTPLGYMIPTHYTSFKLSIQEVDIDEEDISAQVLDWKDKRVDLLIGRGLVKRFPKLKKHFLAGLENHPSKSRKPSSSTRASRRQRSHDNQGNTPISKNSSSRDPGPIENVQLPSALLVQQTDFTEETSHPAESDPQMNGVTGTRSTGSSLDYPYSLSASQSTAIMTDWDLITPSSSYSSSWNLEWGKESDDFFIPSAPGVCTSSEVLRSVTSENHDASNNHDSNYYMRGSAAHTNVSGFDFMPSFSTHNFNYSNNSSDQNDAAADYDDLTASVETIKPSNSTMHPTRRWPPPPGDNTQ